MKGRDKTAIATKDGRQMANLTRNDDCFGSEFFYNETEDFRSKALARIDKLEQATALIQEKVRRHETLIKEYIAAHTNKIGVLNYTIIRNFWEIEFWRDAMDKSRCKDGDR